MMKTWVIVVVGLLFCFSAGDIAAQRIDKSLQNKEERDRLRPRQGISDTELQQQQQQLLQPEPDFSLDVQPLEAPVDPETYVIGPGDIFVVNIWSSLDLDFKIPVSPEGQLILPTIGTIDVEGKTLAEARRAVLEAASRKYLQSTITINLFRLRMFKVHLTGQVLKPGIYQATAMDRVSDIISEGEGLTTWASQRNIDLRHRDGTIDLVDFYAYNQLGKLDANPTLRDGDVIHVPSIQFSAATVRVEGAVNNPGIYQIMPTETIHDFLLRSEALNKSANLEASYIQRKAESNGHLETIPIFPYLREQGNGYSELYLQDGDVIMIPQRIQEVYVVGAVRNQGPYAFYPNLKVIDYVGFAGGTDRAKDISKVQVIRSSTGEEFRGQDIAIEPGDMVVVPQKTDFGVREITTLIITVTNVLLAMKAIGVF